jgi:O-antigen ligase
MTTNLHVSQYRDEEVLPSADAFPAPSAFIEYGLYFYMVYTLVGGVWGLFVNNLASAVLILLVMLSLSELGSQVMTVIKVLAFPLGCGIAFLFIQFVFFEEFGTEMVRGFLIWMLLLFLIQWLTQRANFLHRFCMVMIVIGLAALPYISFFEAGEGMQRAKIDRAIGFSHTNSMGEWYGFCTVYLILVGWITRVNSVRLLAWMGAVLFAYIVTLTVSRGALLAVAIAIVIGSRNFLKGGFLPLLLSLSIGGLVIELGLFDQSARLYATRGAEESGRLAVWPIILESFYDSPWIGVGNSHVGATTRSGHFFMPHNGFLYIAQASGIVPLLLFAAYWVRVSQATFKANTGLDSDRIFYLPFIAYSIIIVSLNDLAFMQFPVISSLAFPMVANVKRRTPDLPGTGSRAPLFNSGM